MLNELTYQLKLKVWEKDGELADSARL